MTAVQEPTTHDPEWSRGERLAKARKVAGYTQETMAEMLVEKGIRATPASVASWEVDRSQPRHMMEVYEVWSQITGTSVEWLLGLRTERFLSVPPLLGQLSLDDLAHPPAELASA